MEKYPSGKKQPWLRANRAQKHPDTVVWVIISLSSSPPANRTFLALQPAFNGNYNIWFGLVAEQTTRKYATDMGVGLFEPHDSPG